MCLDYPYSQEKGPLFILKIYIKSSHVRYFAFSVFVINPAWIKIMAIREAHSIIENRWNSAEGWWSRTGVERKSVFDRSEFQDRARLPREGFMRLCLCLCLTFWSPVLSSKLSWSHTNWGPLWDRASVQVRLIVSLVLLQNHVFWKSSRLLTKNVSSWYQNSIISDDFRNFFINCKSGQAISEFIVDDIWKFISEAFKASAGMASI
jgi:hypothetical protein